MSDEFKVQWSVSLPPAAQYAKGDMLNIRGNSVEEVQLMFNEILDDESQFLQDASALAALLRSAAVVSDGMEGPADGPAATEGKSDGKVVGQDRFCDHGKREYRSGTKNGKEWAAWFCPSKNKSEQCKPQWKD